MKKTRKTKATETKLGRGLIKGLKEAIAFEQGQINLRTKSFEIPDVPPAFTKTQVKEVRERLLNVSQPVFALMLGVSDGAVKAWEQGANEPSGSAARLIQIAKKDPELFKLLMTRIAD